MFKMWIISDKNCFLFFELKVLVENVVLVYKVTLQWFDVPQIHTACYLNTYHNIIQYNPYTVLYLQFVYKK